MEEKSREFITYMNVIYHKIDELDKQEKNNIAETELLRKNVYSYLFRFLFGLCIFIIPCILIQGLFNNVLVFFSLYLIINALYVDNKLLKH